MSDLSSNAQAARGLKLGRAAGFGYLAMAVAGAFWFGVMVSFKGAGPAAFLDHIRDSRFLFELSILAGGLSFVAYLTTAVFLYRRYIAEAPIAVSLLSTFIVASVPLSLAAIARQMEFGPMLDGSGLSAPDLQVQAAALLRSFDSLMSLSSLFWGLWLLPLAWLAWRSGRWGKAVGALLTLGGLGYMIPFLQPALSLAGVGETAFTAVGAMSVFGELTAILWLLLAADRPAKPA